MALAIGDTAIPTAVADTTAALAPGAGPISPAPGAISRKLGRPRAAAIDPLALPAGQMVALLIMRGKDSGPLIAALRASVAVDRATPTHEDYFALVGRGLAVLAASVPSLTLTGICAADQVARALGEHVGPARFILARAGRRGR